MKKLVVAALVLGLVGVAAAGTYVAKSIFCDGVCPLSGKPIHSQEPAAQMLTMKGIDDATPAASHCPSAAAATLAAEATPAAESCPSAQMQCNEASELDCCRKKVDCGKCETKTAPAPAPTKTENP